MVEFRIQLRFVQVQDDANYHSDGRGSRTSRRALERRTGQEFPVATDGPESGGIRAVQWKSAWSDPGAGYQGINTWWRDPGSGQIFEVQFHTPESFDAKMVTHDLYKQRRIPGVDPSVQEALKLEEDKIFDAIPRPEGSIGFKPEEFAP